MAISIVNLTPLSSPNGIFSPNDIPASTTGNLLVVAIAWNSGGGSDTNSSVTDNVSDSFNKVTGASSGGTDIWHTVTAGGATSIDLHEPVFFSAWCYELHSTTGPITLADSTAADSGGANVSSINLAAGTQTVTFTPDFPARLQCGGAVFTDGVDNFFVGTCNYCASPSTGTTKIASVSSPWTLDPYVVDPYSYFFDFGAAHYLTAAPPALSVTPSSLNFTERVWGFHPCQGDGQGNDGTDQGQQLTITASGAWSVTSDNWLQCIQNSGTGNGTVSVNLRNLYSSSLPLTTNLPTRIKSGTYSGSVTVTPASGSPIVVPVTFVNGYGDQLQQLK